MTVPKPPTYDEQLAARVTELLPDVNNGERLELLAAMDPDDMRQSLAWLLSYSPKMFDYALVRDRKLVERLQERIDHEYDDDPEPYCSACGADIGIFHGRGPDWHHYRTVSDSRSVSGTGIELYDAGHAPAPSWREAGAR